MWTLWQPGMEEQSQPDGPIWDESGWFSYNADGTAKGNIRDFAKAKTVTRKFFPAVAQWLGERVDCPCAETGKGGPSAAESTATTVYPVPPLPALPPAQSRLAADTRTTTLVTSPNANAPSTDPVQLIARESLHAFPGRRWNLSVGSMVGPKNQPVKTLYRKTISNPKGRLGRMGRNRRGMAEPWAWEPITPSCPRTGRIVRKIALTWVKP